MRRFANQFVAFRTELEVISEQLPVAAVATHNLFTYGTLQDEKVQLYTFSRKLMGTLDRLENYNLSDHLVAGAYPTIHPTENADDYVSGQVYVLTHEELLKADTYEGNGYRRIEVMLSSGKKAWVYFSA